MMGNKRIALIGLGGIALSAPVFTHEVNDELVHEPIEFTKTPDSHNLARAFVDYLRDRAGNQAPIEDGIEVMRVLDAVYESARTGREALL